MENLKIKVHQGPQVFNDLADEWLQLESDSWWAVYTRPEWFLAWWKTYGKKTKLFTVTAHSNGQLVGILPVCQRRTDKRGLFLPIVEPLSGAEADYHCPIVKKGWEAIALPQMLQQAWDIFSRSGTFSWPHIPDDSKALSVIRGLIKRNNLLSVETKDVCPRFIFAQDYQSTEKMWKGSHRIDVRRQRKRLAERGTVRLWTASTKEEIKEILPELFAVHDKRWNSRGLPGKFNEPLIREYYYQMVDCLWGRGLHFSTLMCNGTHISYHFGFTSGGWLLFYKPAYRIEYQNFSPTKVHISYLIEEGIRAGWKGIDFLRGDEPYKRQWAQETMQVISFIIGFKRLSPSYFWFSQGKPWAKRRFQDLYMKLKAKKERLFK